jgi:hypothetical protein
MFGRGRGRRLRWSSRRARVLIDLSCARQQTRPMIAFTPAPPSVHVRSPAAMAVPTCMPTPSWYTVRQVLIHVILPVLAAGQGAQRRISSLKNLSLPMQKRDSLRPGLRTGFAFGSARPGRRARE